MTATFDETWFHAGNLRENETTLDEGESTHLQRVLRLGPGETIVVADGRGLVRSARIRSLGKRVALDLEETLVEEPSPPRMSLLLSVLKGRDVEEPVEAVCQLPLGRIQLVLTDHCQTFKSKDWQSYAERLIAKSVTAMKQARKAWCTEILAPVPLDAWVGAHPDARLILSHPGEDRLPSAREGGDLHLLTGPEGGISERELGKLRAHGCYNLGLGPTRIRAVHAPLLALGKLMGLGYF